MQKVLSAKIMGVLNMWPPLYSLPYFSASGNTDNKSNESKERNIQEEHSTQKGSRRLASSLIHVVYNRQHSIFEVTKKSKNYLASMGVPLKNGGHVLFPEEAIYLVEHCNACATDQGRVLTLHDGYRILGECGVSMHVYRAYTSLRQVGFVVLRPSRAFVHSLPLNQEPLAQQEQSVSKHEKYPQRLLDCFPTFDHQRLIMPHLHRCLLFVPIPDLHSFKISDQGFNKPRRWQRDFRQKLRPRYWPDLDEVRNTASTWPQFAHLRRKLIEATRAAAPAQAFEKSKPEYNYDFEVFLPDRFRHSQPSTPAFRVNCVDSRYGAMSCSLVNQFAGDIPLVLSIFDCGHVCFIEVSGEPIDLNEYLRKLVEKFEKL
ncbi:hypothetical protein Y032_0164g3561 [Ancylostoma ceylanicum]|uniref:tRNA-splicing endonuclease subunit Sen54 N-terminal domain-containing protein n=1 Tax=Ancylostoma ceylanicum TaxID=53326 RepID=A0A016SXF5_9BILA|nr:hypothetical protein Y032_0164g3561 [Ancylostoma ceylanicum]